MEELRNKVYAYYLEHFEELPADKQFHFASRLYLWSQDAALRAALDNKLRAEFTANDSPTAAFQEIVTRTQAEVSHGSKNAAELRRPYFESYPHLKMYVSLLFRLLFLKTIYGIDAKAELLAIVSDKELAEYERRLLQDPQALAILSTHAINFLYLYRKLLHPDQKTWSPEVFLPVGRTGYDHNDKTHLQLLIYLYTHCIIGESSFYYQRPTDYPETYETMLAELEALISERFADINLDNKFEYLVCCRLMGVTSNLETQIFEEAAKSLSPAGDYLIDTHNNNPQMANSTLDLSEHRNSLFLMATRPFKPLA